MNDIISYLPEPRFKVKRLRNYQSTKDIAKAVLLAEYNNRIYTPILHKFFSSYQGSKENINDLKKAYQYVIDKIIYIAEKEPQSVKSLPRLLNDGYGDCKHFATIMANISRALGFKYFFRLTSYNKFDKTPTHIYICIIYDNKIIPVDPVYKQFGGEKAYYYKYDYKPIKNLEYA